MGSNKNQPAKQMIGTKIGKALTGLALIAAAALTPQSASAQTEPAFRFGNAPLVTPTAAASYYGGLSQTHTSGPGAGITDEIKSLAKGLDYDPDLILEYVRDNVEFYPTFGLGKGALGAHLDKSGNAFDQAHLIAQLLEEAEANNAAITISNVKIHYGTLSVSDGALAGRWLGVTDAGDACRLLARGGIPGKVNNSTNCAGLSGAISSVEVGHAWVKASIGGQTETFDAAFKDYEVVAPFTVGGNDFRDALPANCSNANLLSTGAPSVTNTQSGSPYAQSFNYAGIESQLDSCAQSLWIWIENNKPNASVEEILGYRKIKPGAPSVTPAYTPNSNWDWNQVPDPFRVKFSVDIDRNTIPDGEMELAFDLFMDDIYGKRVELYTNGFGDDTPISGLPPESELDIYDGCNDQDYHYIVRLRVDGVYVPGEGMQGPCHPAARGAYTTITVDAPYAADGGAYQNQTFFTNNHTLVTRAMFVVSAGETSSDWARFYQKGLGVDRKASQFWNGDLCCGTENIEQPVSVQSGARVAEHVRYRVFAAWAEQFSNLQTLTAGVAGAPIQHHYTVGWSYGYSQVALRCESSGTPCEVTLGEDATILSLDTAASTPADDPALNRTLANAAAALEASVMEQQLDTTAPGGVARKFHWGNLSSRSLPAGVSIATPHGTDPQGDYPVYLFDSLQDDLTILTSDGEDDCVDAFVQRCLEGSLVGGVEDYLNAGYHVVAVGDAYLGPGLRCGRYYSSTTALGGTQWHCDANVARGGAFIAYKPDFSEIAHVAVSGQRLAKGGAAGSSIPEELRVVDIPTPADLLKEEEEDAFLHTADLRTGRLNLSTGALITAGTGEFPYSLPFSRSFQSGESGLTDPVWSHNWHLPLSISGSGNEMLGSSRALFASQSLAYLVGLYGAFNDSGTTVHDIIKQETVGALAAAWWSDKLVHNVVSATVSGQTQQFVRKLNTDEFWPTAGGAARVTQTNENAERYQYYSYATQDLPGPQRITSLVWRTDNLDFQLENADGDIITYTFWRPYYLDPMETAYFPQNGRSSLDKPGWRATSWDFPTGQSITFSYTSTATDQACRTSCEKPSLDLVANSIGRSLEFTGDWENPGTVEDDANRTVMLTDTSVTHSDSKVTNYGVTLIDNTYTNGRVIYEKYLDAVTEPGHASANHQFGYDLTGKIRSYTNALNNSWTYFIGGGGRGATRDPYGNDAVEYYDRDGNKIRSITKTGETTLTDYDGAGRLIERTMPEGNRLLAAYDEYSNVIEVKHCGKTDANCASPLTTSATYQATWKTKPTSVTDPMGNTTDITYWGSGAKSGKVRYVDQPAAATGQPRPRWTYDYDANGRLVSAINPEGEATSASYGALGIFTGVTVDPGGLNLATAITAHNAWGDPTSVNGPRTDVTDVFTFTYDNARRPLTTTDPMGSVSETKYDAHGWPVKECVQIADAPTVTCTNASPGNTQWAVTATTYSATGQPLTVADPDGNVSSTFYDALDRPVVTVDAAGRKTRTVYDAAGRTVKVIRAWDGANDGTGATTDCSAMRTATAADPQNALQQCYQQYDYTPNGQIAWVNDANGQRTEYVYDDFDRLEKTEFPSKTRATVPNVTLPDGTDYEQYTYDGNGNMLTKRARDGRTITFTYDKLNRLSERVVPGSGNASGEHEDFTFTYDLLGRQLTAFHWGTALQHSYDAAGRPTSKTVNGKMPVSYAYDKASNITQLTYPDGWAVDFAFDALGRVTTASEQNGTAARTLATLTYDRLSRRKSIDYDNSTSPTTYTYTARGDLTNHFIDFSGGAGTYVSYAFGYNPVGQLLSETVSHSEFSWSPGAPDTDTYVSNGLNQYTSVDGASPVYDGNGNITTDHRGRTYTYSAENQLYQAREAGTNALLSSNVYYADGTRRLRSGGGTPAQRFYYDGDQEILETDSGWLDAGVVTRRYVRLPGSVDEPFLMIDYTASASCDNNDYSACEVWAHQNRLGSVVATSASNGNLIDTYTYSPYGESGPEGDTGFPFRFTGQKLDPETGLYYYKARFYDPETGRFLQTDPIGYEDQMNFYAYVANDPVNGIDPDGREGCHPEKGCPGNRESDNKNSKALAEAGTAADIFIEEKQALDAVNEERRGDPTAAGADKDHHCTANCEATKLGETGEKTAKALSDGKENFDKATGRNTQEQSDADQRANEAGREFGRQEQVCRPACERYVQENENPDYESRHEDDDP